MKCHRICFFLFFCSIVSLRSHAQSLRLLSVSGQVIDERTGAPLSFANVGISGKTIGTGTNAKGEFSLKLSNTSINDSLQVSFIGYTTKKIAIKSIKEEEIKIGLSEDIQALKEVRVKPMKPYQLIEEVVRRIPENYDTSPTMLKGFYRESVKAESDPEYILFAEGVLDVYKNPYQYIDSVDYVRVEKGRIKQRRAYFLNKGDTIKIPEITQGPNLGIMLDVVKNPSLFLFEAKYYYFEFDPETSYNNRPVYVLKFRPRIIYNVNSSAFFKGKVYIDFENYALIGADFEYEKFAYEQANIDLFRKIDLINRRFRVNYESFQKRWYLKSASVENLWKHRKTRVKLDNRMYFLTTDRLAGNVKMFDKDEIITRDMSLGYSISFKGDDFWEEFNILRSEDEPVKKK